MQKHHQKTGSIIVTGALFMVSLFSLCLGLTLCLTKSPSAQSSYYLALSHQYEAQLDVAVLQPESEKYLLEQSREMIEHSIHATPYNASSWSNLSVTLAQLNKMDKAVQARDIAQDLGASSLLTFSALRSLSSGHDVAFSKHNSLSFVAVR